MLWRTAQHCSCLRNAFLHSIGCLLLLTSARRCHVRLRGDKMYAIDALTPPAGAAEGAHAVPKAGNVRRQHRSGRARD